MVDQFQTELLPVAAQLTARLVRAYIYICVILSSIVLICGVCVVRIVYAPCKRNC